MPGPKAACSLPNVFPTVPAVGRKERIGGGICCCLLILFGQKAERTTTTDKIRPVSPMRETERSFHPSGGMEEFDWCGGGTWHGHETQRR